MPRPLQPDLVVNGEVIPARLIAAEAQNHVAPAGKPGFAWVAAARALAIRALLLQEAGRLGFVPEPGFEVPPPLHFGRLGSRMQTTSRLPEPDGAGVGIGVVGVLGLLDPLEPLGLLDPLEPLGFFAVDLLRPSAAFSSLVSFASPSAASP